MLTGEHFLQVFGAMRAFDDLGRAVVAPDAFDQCRVVGTLALGDENMGGSPQIAGRFAQGAARQEIFVAERCLPVDQHEVEPVLEMEVLQAVVEDERVRAELFDGVAPGFDPVFVHDHENPRQILREHVRLVACFPRAEQNVLAVADHARDGSAAAPGQPRVPAFEQRRAAAFVSTAEDGHPTTFLLQCARQAFYHRRLAGAADGQVTDADDHATQRVVAQKTLPVQPQPQLHHLVEHERKREQQPPQQRRALAITALQDHVDGKLLQAFDPAAHGQVR